MQRAFKSVQETDTNAGAYRQCQENVIVLNIAGDVCIQCFCINLDY